MRMLRGLTLSLVVCAATAFLPLPARLSPTTTVRATSSKVVMMSAAPAAPQTFSVGSQLTDDTIAYEAVSKFIEGPVELAPTSGGVNNVVQYVTLPDGHKYILRVYNNGFNSKRVKWEHDILKQLKPQQLSFSVPTPLPTRADPTTTHTLLSNGAEAAMFEIIPGKLPKLTCVRDIGRASGELLEAIQKVKLDPADCPTPPYHDFYEVHHAIDRDSFFREIRGSDFDNVREAADVAAEYVVEMEKTIEDLLKADLPKCIIHGDLHYDNVLVHEDAVSGLLDFEFCAYDWRAMELAVCLSKYAGEKDAWKYFDEFIDGFAQYGRLTQPEVDAIPDLINLRILSNVVYFVGRALAKEDDISSITTRIENYNKRVQWVKDTSSKIKDTITAKLAAANKK